ncbi:hypothetical protein [Streptomyces sp. NPDC055186]
MSIFRRGRSGPDRVTVRQAERAPRAHDPRAAAGPPVTDPHGANGART